MTRKKKKSLFHRFLGHSPFKPFFKGVVDKNFEVVDNFHGGIRNQLGQLPQKPSQFNQFDEFRKTLCLCAIFCVENGFSRIPTPSRLLVYQLRLDQGRNMLPEDRLHKSASRFYAN